MANKNYQVGLLITGDAKKGFKATQLTRDGLKDLSTQQKKTGKTTKDLSSKTGSMMGKLGMVASVVGVATAALGSMAAVMRTQAITEMKVMADTLNLSTQTLSEWSTAGEKFNVGGEKMADIFKDLQDKIGDFAATGGGEAKDIFKKLNLDINEFVGLSADQQLLKIGSALDDVASHSEKIFFLEALANDASRLLPLLENGAKGLQKAQNEARVLGTSISDVDAEKVALAGREFQRSKDIAVGLANEISIALSPAFVGMNDTIIDTIGSMGGWEGAAHSTFDNITIWTAQFGETWSLVKEDFNITDEVSEIDSAFGEIGKFSDAFIDELAARFDYLFEVLRDYPAHYRTVVGIVFGEVQKLWEKIKLGTTLFFSFLDEGWQNMSHAAGNAWGFIELSFAELSDSIIEMMAGAISTVADGLALIPKMDEQAASVQAASDALNGMAVAGARVKAEQEAANIEHEKQLGIISLVRDLAAADNKASIKEINDRILLIIKERDALIQKSNDARKAAKKAREAEAKERIAEATKSLVNPSASTPITKRSDITQMSEDYEKLIKQVDDFSGAWASAGNVIVDTFGSIGQQMEKLFTSQDKYTEALKFNRAEQAKDGADLKKLKAEEISLTYASTQAELNSYSSIAGAAAGMFSEKTAAAKAFHTVETAMAIASLAMSAEKMIMGNTETTSYLANEALKQGANALTAITSAFGSGPIIGFATGAAMIAIMAGLGVFSGGSGTAPESAASRQETQGTGTVLGSDDKSASIANAIERQEELQLDQYVEMREMNDSLNDLNNNITYLATSFVSNFGKFNEASYSGTLGKTEAFKGKIAEFHKIWAVLGDPVGDFLDSVIGSFKTTKKSLIDSGISIVSQTMKNIMDGGSLQAQQYFDIKTKKKSFWGASSSTSYNTEYEDVDDDVERELGLVFQSLGNTVLSAVDVLGVDVANNLNDYEIDLPNISFKDLSGDEIQAELEAVISQQADYMAEFLLPTVRDFQKVGEGPYETLSRLAQELTVFNSVLEITGNTLNSIDANQTIEATQAIIDFAGGIENLQSAASDFFNGFYSESEQFEYNQKQLTEQFSALGQELPATADGFKKLVQGLDPLNEADQRLYAQLLLLSGQTAEYYDALENTIEAEQELANARKTFNADLTEQIAQMDLTPLEQSLHNLNNQYLDDLANALELGADVQLLEVFYGKQRTAIIEEQLSNAKTSFDTAINGIGSSLEKLIDSISNSRTGIASSIRNIKREMGGFDEVGFINGNINGLYNQIGQGSVDEQIVAVNALNDKIVSRYELELEQFSTLSELGDERYQTELDQYKNLKSALASIGSYANGLSLSSYSPLSASQRLSTSRNQFSNDLSAANNFDLDAMNSITASADAYLAEARNMYGSSGQFNAIFNSVQSSLAQLATTSLEAPDVPTDVELYQEAALALQTNTIGELQGLNTLLSDLETQATIEADSQNQQATLQYNNQVAIINKTNELSQAQLEGQKLANELAKKQIEQQQSTIELNEQQIVEQQQTNDALAAQIAQLNQVVSVLSQQLSAIKEGNSNVQETNAHIVHQARQA